MNPSGNGRRYAAWGAALLVAVPILVLFGPVSLSDRSLAMRDAAHFYHPLLEWTSTQWRSGRPPLWNPYENGGVPLLADASSSIFYPGRLLLLLPLDFAWRYKLYVIGHVILAAGGAYLLARHWRCSALAAAMAAMSYACSGSVAFQYANVVFLVGAAWLPFAVWATDWSLVDRSWRGACVLGVCLALMVLGGDPQMAYHTVLMAAGYALLLSLGSNTQSSSSHWSLRLGAMFSLVGMAAMVGLLLAAVQVLPSLETAMTSDRAYYQRPRNLYEAGTELAGPGRADADGWPDVARGLFGQPEAGSHHERVYEFSLPPWRLVELLWPNVGGRMFPAHRRWLSLVPAEGRIWTPTIYMGLVPLLLALTQFRFRRAESRQAWLSWLVVLFTLGSFGGYGLGWLAREFYATALGGDPDQVPIGSPLGGLYWLLVTVLPGYVSFRYPAKLLVVASLAASQLAACGWDRVLVDHAQLLRMIIKGVAVASLLLLAGCCAGFFWLNHLDPLSPPGQSVAAFLVRHADSSLGPFDLRGCQRDVSIALIQTIVICVITHWLLRLAARSERLGWQWGLLAVVSVDLALANGWLVATAPAETWRAPPAVAAAIASDPLAKPIVGGDATRVFRADLLRWRPASFRVTSSADRLAQIAVWERDTLFPKYGLNHGISLVESYGSLKSVDYESLLLVAKTSGPPTSGEDRRLIPHPAALQLLGARYLILPANLEPRFPGQRPFAMPVHPPQNVPIPEGAKIWRLLDPLPRAWIVHDVEQLPPLSGRHLEDVDARARHVLFHHMADHKMPPARDFRSSAVVETDLPLELPRADSQPTGESCRVISYGQVRVEIDASLNVPGLVILNDAYAPGWNATVKTQGVERTVDILRTNRVCRGIWLPAGQHRIRYEYRPRSFMVGVWLSGASWLALAVVSGWFLVSRRLRSWISRPHG